jgi:hypothetical protein
MLGLQPGSLVLVAAKAIKMQIISPEWTTLTSRLEQRPHIRRDRILQEALATGADPLHLTLVFSIDHTNAAAYASAASNILSGPAEQALLPVARNEHRGAVRGECAERACRPRSPLPPG